MNLNLIFILILIFQFSLVKNEELKCKNEKHRPQFHFSPNLNWINDPNGMVYYNGEYHLFYQYNPFDTVWGPMHWGHAISPDMVNWEELPIALYPDELGTIFSGGGVLDYKNSSGFKIDDVDPLIAIFTHDGQSQQQSIAFSLNYGRTFEKYEGNPVIPNPGIRDFRDPKVGDYYGKWIQSLAVGNRISFYDSEDLKNWNFLSDFGQDLPPHFHRGVWECPDLLEFEFEGRAIWVLIVSINPGGPNDGSGTKYFIGDFDGTNYVHYNGDEILWVDHGPDNYAGVTFTNDPFGRYVLIGWMNNWAYANELPTELWRGQMTIPRKLSLSSVNGIPYLVSYPVQEMELLRKLEEAFEIREHFEIPANYFIDLMELVNFRNPLMEFDLELDITHAGLNETYISICFFKENGPVDENLCVLYDTGATDFIIDRSKSGDVQFHPNFKQVAYAVRTPFSEEDERKNLLPFKIFIDVASIEIFADNGLTAMTALYFPTEPFDRIQIMYVSTHFESSVIMQNVAVNGLNSIHSC